MISYEYFLKSTTFHQFLGKVLNNIKLDLAIYNISDGFIAFLDGKKINERFKLISSFGRFSTTDNTNIISAKEVDILSIVYMSKKFFFKNNIYVEIIEQDKKDIFLYIEFDNVLNENTREKLEIFFISVKKIILQKEWIDE